jgi:diguanylate cyclase (GGDEF)-like protein/PAS domain S-box-containing protein
LSGDSFNRAIYANKQYDFNHRIIRLDGTERIVHEQGEVIFDENDNPLYFLGTVQDITKQRIFESRLEDSQQQLGTLIDSMPDLVILKDDSGRWIQANNYSLSLFRLEGIKYKGKNDIEIASDSDLFWECLLACFRSDEDAWKAGTTIRVEEQITTQDGNIITLDVLKTPIFNFDGSRKFLIVVGRDISDRKKIEELNRHLALHDSLTSLPNRRNFEEKLEQFLLVAKATQQKLAVLYLDLDRFKYINDTLGHLLGDELLRFAAVRIKNCLPDNGFVARLGGDEFVIILQNSLDYSVKVARDILSSFEKPFYIDSYELYITTSIGISVYPEDGTDVQTLMKDADVALYRAKEKGKNGIQIYNTQMNIGTYKSFILERDLHKAIRNEEFEIYYQPRIDSDSGKIVSGEALIRWHHPDWGMVPPNEFIPLARETNLIIQIGEWVTEKVCKQIHIWQQEGLSPIPISVNIDPKRFAHKDFVSNVKRTLEENKLDSKWLEIEVTENSLMENEEVAINNIRALQQLGVKISLDDFGTGYSSISYLRDFNFNYIKIDKSYIQDINSNSTNTKIVKGMIQLAKSLDISIVAEGVETIEQLMYLKEHDCDQIQGYLFSKPVPAEDFKKLLRKGMLEPDSIDGLPDFHIENQRKYFRINLHFPLSTDMTIIKIKGHNINLGKMEALIEDIGLGGLRFLSTTKLAVQRNFTLEFETEILGKIAKFYGTVVWRREIEDGIYQYGLEFFIREGERSYLAKLLNDFNLLLRKSPLVPNCRFIKTDRINYLKDLLKK